MKTTEKLSELPATCLEMNSDIPNDGDFLTSDVASGYINNYLTGINDLGGQSHNFGFVFGLNNINTFIGGITAFNAGLPAAQQIQGVRIYLGRQEPIVPGTAIPLDQVLDSLFLMPVLGDGTDLYKVAPLVDPNMILGDPRPCPNECLILSFVTE
jgi:hypothetical protein